MSGSQRFYIRIFGILTGVFWFSQFVFVPYMTPYVALLGASNLLIGIMVGSFGLSQILVRIPLGIISDKMNNRKLFIIAGCAVGAVSAIGLWISTDIFIIILMRFLTGVSASTWVCFTVLYASYFPPGESVKVLGILTGYNYVGQTAGYIVAAVIATRFGMTSTFIISLAGFFIAMIMSFFVKETKVAQALQHYSLRDFFVVSKDRWVLKITIMCGIFEILVFATCFGFTPQLATQLGANEMELAGVPLIFTITSIPTSMICGSLGKRFGNQNILTISSLIFALSCLLQPFCANMFVLYILLAIGGFARGFYFPVLLGLSIKNAPYEKQAIVMGYFQAVYSIGIMAGPIIAGAVSQVSSLTVMFIVIGIIGLITPVISILGMREEKRISQV